jgi:hypothetical protein
MDFVLTKGIDACARADQAFAKRTDRSRSSLISQSFGRIYVLAAAHHGEFCGGADSFCFFDGQFSDREHFFHSVRPANSSLMDTVVRAFTTGEFPSNGVFCIGRTTGTEQIEICTDWLNQYPVYIWKDRESFAVANNLAMLMEVVPNLGRSIWASAENLVTGGTLSGSHVEGVERVPFGYMLRLGETLELMKRPDHEPIEHLSYSQVLETARAEIERHLGAALQAAGDPDINIVTDITGGSDSRCVLSFLIASGSKLPITGRSLTQYPSPDANIAGLMMERFAIPVARCPVVGFSTEKAVRINASLSGGGRDSGTAGYPVLLDNLFHFKGTYGELGGATPGLDYVAAAAEADDYSHAKAVDIFIGRRRSAHALDLITSDALEIIKHRHVGALRNLEQKGYGREQLIAELYLINRCRTHFGLASFVSNKAAIFPDILANRWLVEARRKLPAKLHTKNKVIFDLIVATTGHDMAFMPMADKKWSEIVVPAERGPALKAMQVINNGSDNLSKLSGPLYAAERIADPAPLASSYLKTPPARTASPVSAQALHIGPYQAILKELIVNVDASNEIWKVYDRNGIEAAVKKAPENFGTNGVEINAMGIVAAGMFWKLGLGLQPTVH